MVKFIITGTLPKTGGRFAFSGKDGGFALVFFQGRVVRGAFAWDSFNEAQDYLDAQLKAAPDLEKLGPFNIEEIELPH